MSAQQDLLPPHDVGPDLSTCEREPIHIPGSIQPHGYLLVIDDGNLTVSQASENAGELFGRPLAEVLGGEVSALFGAEQGHALADCVAKQAPGQTPEFLQNVVLPPGGKRRSLNVIGHHFGGKLILEVEAAETGPEFSFRDLYTQGREFLSMSQQAADIEELLDLAATEVRRITGFDRVLIYRFDPSWHGHVLAESRTEAYPSYMDLWFPASDIPPQARRLYQMNRTRLIADVQYTPVPIVARDQGDSAEPLDLTFSLLRSVSPVHIEYLKNMGVQSSMSISILTRRGELWGLISCHHHKARVVSFETRTTCDFVAQALAVQIESQVQREAYEHKIRLKSIMTQLLALMAREDEFIQGLIKYPEVLLPFAAAGGAAVLYEGRCHLLGVTPSEEQVWQLVDWLVSRGREEIYHTDCLPATMAGADAFRDSASGILAISISKIYRSYVVWFRPEVVRTVSWGGDPRKPVEPEADGSMRLHPRKSFETWKETVRGRSLPWLEEEYEAAGELRNAVIGIVLRKAEELAQVSAELQRSNKELESFSYSISHDLRAPFRHIAGYAELLLQSSTAELGEKDLRYLNTIIKSAHFAGTLVDNLLSFSQVGRSKLHVRHVDMGLLAREIHREADMDTTDRAIVWDIGSLPAVEGDPLMLRLVWQNLVQNAIKFSRSRETARIQIGSEQREREFVFWVKDNGVGFDQKYADKLFGVFQRLHRMEEFEGTGIGLANVRRIIARHGGRTWAEGELDKGATFYFTLPVANRREEGSQEWRVY